MKYDDEVKEIQLSIRATADDRAALDDIARTLGKPFKMATVVRGFAQSNRKCSREELLPMVIGGNTVEPPLALDIHENDRNRLAVLANAMGYSQLESFIVDVVRATLGKSHDEVREWLIGRALREMKSDNAAAPKPRKAA